MIRDEDARNAVLDMMFGADRGPLAADSHEVLLLDGSGDELTEVTAPGYERATLLPADWLPADGSSKRAFVTFAPPSDEWTVQVVSYQLVGVPDGWVWHEAGLVDPLDVTAASPVGPSLTVTVTIENVGACP